MSTLLIIPFKASRPTSLTQAVKHYIETYHPETHPDAFRLDVTEWERLRKDAVAGGLHFSKINSALLYHAQLVFIMTKLPPDIGLDVAYDPIWQTPSTTTYSTRNLCFERVNVLVNLAALYSQLARTQDRSTADGIKFATNFNALACGTLSYIVESALPQWQATHGRQTPIDYSPAFFTSLEWVMRAQSLECMFEKARAANPSSALLPKFCSTLSDHYQKSLKTIETAVPEIASAFPQDWKADLAVKAGYYEALAQQYQASLVAAKMFYGEGVARLGIALVAANSAYDTARRSGTLPQVLKDMTRELRTALEKELESATRDNDLIYHNDVPAAQNLEAIPVLKIDSTKSIPGALQDPGQLVGGSKAAPLFGDLLAHGASAAIELYKDRRENWLKDEIYDVKKAMDAEIVQKLVELHLPAALEAQTGNTGLPPSLLGKAEEIRMEGGNARIHKMIDDRTALSERCKSLIDGLFETLDEEAEQDEELRQEYASKDPSGWTREASSVANKHLVAKAEQYLAAMDKARVSDGEVDTEWLQYHDHIALLGRPDAEIEAALPSVSRVPGTIGSSSTRLEARKLRDLLDEITDLQKEREELITRIKRFVASDDVQPRISREAATFEKWVEVKPAMFEKTISSELDKYIRFKNDLESGKATQAELLKAVEGVNGEFVKHRANDPAIKAREEAIHTLEQAYQHYKTAVDHVGQGVEFYNKMTVVASNVSDEVKSWVAEREASVQWLTDPANRIPEATPAAVVNPPSTVPQPVSPPQPVASTSKAVATASPAAVSSPQSPWQPKSRMVQAALVATPSRPQPPQNMDIDLPDAPWKETVYHRELTGAGADWEDSPPRALSQSQKAKKYARELGNEDDWEDGDSVLPPPPPKSKTPAKPPRKSVAKVEDSSPAPSSRRSTRTKVPAS